MSNVDGIQLMTKNSLSINSKKINKKQILNNKANEKNEKLSFNNLDNFFTAANTFNTKNDFISIMNSNTNKDKQIIEKNNSQKGKNKQQNSVNVISPLNLNASIKKIVNEAFQNTIRNQLTDPSSHRPITQSISIMNTHQNRNKGLPQEKIKQVKNLKRKEETIKRTLYQLNQNQRLLENESYINIGNSLIDNNIKLDHLKELKYHKNCLYNKLEQITSQIGDIMTQESLREKNDKVKQYIREFNTINNDYDEKIHEYENQSLQLKQKRMNSLSQDKRIKELEEIEKNIKIQKEQLLLNNKEKENELAKKRKERMNTQMEKTRKYINEQYKKKKNDYLFYSNKEQYNQKEKKLLDKVKIQKKDQLIPKQEWIELENKIKGNQLLILKQAKEKQNLMKEMWKNRSQSLPPYESKIQKIVEYEKMKQIEDEENKRLYKIAISREGLNYAKEHISQPKPNPKLKREREKLIIRLTIKPRPSEDKLKIRKEVFKQLVNHKKSKSLNMPVIEPISQHRKLHDYLSDLKAERQEHNIPIRKYNWEKMLNTDKGTMTNNIEMVKLQTKSIDKLASDQIKFMRINGGYSKKPELGNKISDLLLDSIKAKVMILNKIQS